MLKPNILNIMYFLFIVLYFLSLQLFADSALSENPNKVPENMVLVLTDDFAYRDDKNLPSVESFYIDKYEVTNHFYCQFLNEADPYGLHYTSEMEIGRQGNPGNYSYAVKKGKEIYPVQYVSALDAEAFTVGVGRERNASIGTANSIWAWAIVSSGAAWVRPDTSIWSSWRTAF